MTPIAPRKSMSGNFGTARYGQGWRRTVACIAALAGASGLQANPTGGTVVGGSATIGGTGTPVVTVNQASNIAIINWGTFSIGSGETTTFLQPGASSAVLNRVTGGGISSINGTLNANGRVFLINGNGVYIGSTGAINTSGFTASTQDISNANFTAGKLQFNGTSTNGVQNFGTVNSLGGDIYLIGNTVDNEGTLNAAAGTVGLAAGRSVVVKPNGTEHVFVSPSSAIKTATSATGVTNRGLISATTAELKAANGNMYALAVNNGGTIRATTVQNQGGHVYLTSDSGIIVNTGTINASATAAGGTGGVVTLKTAGTVVHHGTILAQGGQGGIGGSVDLSAANLDFTGGVNLTAPGGKTGTLLLDPSQIEIIDGNSGDGNGVVSTSGTTTTYTPAPGYTGTSTLANTTLEDQLAIANVVVNGVNKVSVDAPVTWGDTTASSSSTGSETASSLTLETTARGGSIAINSPITGLASVTGTDTQPRATLIINCADNGFVTTSNTGSIDVDNFTLENGFWQQIVSANAPSASAPGLISSLPSFTVTNDFHLLNTTTFERFAGGNGQVATPYQIVDIYGVQGIGSPSDTLLGKDYILNNNINTDTENWNGGNGVTAGAGFVPIGEGGKSVQPFSGILNGAGFTISGFYLARPDDNLVGLFGEVTGTVENMSLAVNYDFGTGIAGFIVGRDMGTIQNCSALFGSVPSEASGTTTLTSNQSRLASTGLANAGGAVAGEVMSNGRVITCYSDSGIVLVSSSSGTSDISGLTAFGGIVGVNYGTIRTSISTGSGGTELDVASNGTGSVAAQTISVGGLVGANFGTIDGCESSGTTPFTSGNVLSGNGSLNIGGLVGTNYGTIDGNAAVIINGKRTVVSYQSFSDADVTVGAGSAIEGGTGNVNVGGFVGANYGTVNNGYTAASITGVAIPVDGITRDISDTPGGVVSAAGSLIESALGNYTVGGFVGANLGHIQHSGSEDVVQETGSVEGIATGTKVTTSGTTTFQRTANFGQPATLDSIMVGGFAGYNAANGTISGSFSDSNALDLPLTLDTTNPQTPTAATPGSTFGLSSNSGTLVSNAGTITGGAGYQITGGFVGANYGSINQTYATGDVNVSGTTSQGNSFFTGGFAGVNSNNINNVYAQGDVSALTTTVTGTISMTSAETGVVGGLIGQNNGGTVVNTYSIGTVSGGTTRGGLVGVLAGGAVRGSFWDGDNNPGLTYSGGGSPHETTPTLTINSGDFSTSVFAHAGWNFKTIWLAPASDSFPLLQGIGAGVDALQGP